MGLSVIGQLKGQSTCHTCESGQDASCVHAVVSHFPELTVVVSQKHITEV